MIRFFLHFFVGLSIAVSPLIAVAKSSKTGSKTELALRSLVSDVNAYKSYGDVVRSLPRKADREYLLKELGDGADLPVKLRYVDRDGIFFDAGEVRGTVSVKSFADKKFMIFTREFTLEPLETAEANVTRIRRAFVNGTALHSILLPQADANPAAAIWVARPLVTKTAAYAYLWTALAFTAWCAQGYNTWGACAGMGMFWPWPAFEAGHGLVNLLIDKVKFHFSTAAFDLLDLKCGGITGLSAVIQDEQKQKIELGVRFTSAGAPFNFTMKSPTGAQETFYFKTDWSPDPSRMPGYESKIDQRSFALMAKAIQSLRFACFNKKDGDAMEEYFHRNRKVLKVEPKMDKEGVSAKSVE